MSLGLQAQYYGKKFSTTVHKGETVYVFPEPFGSIKDIPKFSAYDSIPNGKWVQKFSGNGPVALEFMVSNHTMNGPARGYYKDGSLRYEFTFYENFIHKMLTEYYAGGQVFRKYSYNEGLLNGKWVIYYPSGVISAEGNAINEKIVGEVIHYYESSKIKEKRIYDNNVLQFITFFYENGNKKAEGTLQGIDNRTGNWTFWYDNGKIMKEVRYENREEIMINYWDQKGVQMVANGNGRVLIFSPTGQKLEEGSYSNGKKHGKWLVFDTEKNIMRTFYYKQGMPN